jgi:hypothetical protein
MQIKVLWAAIVALVGSFSHVQAHAKDLVLEASSPWVMDYAEDSCALRRGFGEGKTSAQLELRRFAPESTILMTVSTNAMAPTGEDFQFRFDPQQEWRDTAGVYAHFADSSRGVIFGAMLAPSRDAVSDLSPALFLEAAATLNSQQAAASIEGVSLRSAFKNDLVLRTGSLTKPWSAMDKCLHELLTHWGIDAAAHNSLRRRAVPTNLPSTTNMMDYPPKMLAKRLPGIVNVRLMVDQTGTVNGCVIQMPLSDPAFEKSTCTDLENELEFDPALDANGNPIASYWVTQVNFRIAYQTAPRACPKGHSGIACNR